jgi:AraC-like DNA-binding protein
MLTSCNMILRDPQFSAKSAFDTLRLPLGEECCLLLGRGPRFSLPPMQFPVVTLQACWAGTASLCVDDRRIRIEEGDYFPLNAERLMRAEFMGHSQMRAAVLCFRRGLPEEIALTVATNANRLLDSEGHVTGLAPLLTERIVVDDRIVASTLNYIVQNAEQGLSDDVWFEEQFQFLLLHVMEKQQLRLHSLRSLEAFRRGARQEMLRRLDRARDYMLSCFEQQLSLREIAQQAFLSAFHFARLFRQVEGVTTYEFLQRRRARCALDLLTRTQLPLDEVARRAGFNSRVTLFRVCKQYFQRSPSLLRAAGAQASRAA